jgi:hypothetical protein
VNFAAITLCAASQRVFVVVVVVVYFFIDPVRKLLDTSSCMKSCFKTRRKLGSNDSNPFQSTHLDKGNSKEVWGGGHFRLMDVSASKSSSEFK